LSGEGWECACGRSTNQGISLSARRGCAALFKPNAQVAHHLFGGKRFHSARINRTRSALDFRNSFGGQRRLVGISQLVCKSTAKREL